MYGSHLSFVAHKGELTSDNTAVINIPWGEVTDAWKNSKKRSPWDGLGVQVRTKRYRLSQWGIPLGAYNFSGLKTQQEAKEMHKAIEAAIVNFQTKHLAKVRIDNGGRQQEAL